MKKIFFITVLTFSAVNIFSEPIKIGFIESDIEDTVKTHQEAADFIGNKLGMSGGQVVVAGNSTEMADLLKAGNVDIFIDTIFSSLSVQEKSGSKIILRRWKKGVAEYQTLFIALENNENINDFSNLNGTVIGFSDNSSTSARWLPQALLMKMGYTFRETSAPGNNNVGFMYYDDDLEKAVELLFNGKTDLTVMSTNDYEDLDSDVRTKLKIVGRSFDVPRQLISVSPVLDNSTVKQLVNILTTMDSTPEGKKVLGNWEKTEKCDRINMKILDSIKLSKKLLQYMQ